MVVLQRVVLVAVLRRVVLMFVLYGVMFVADVLRCVVLVAAVFQRVVLMMGMNEDGFSYLRAGRTLLARWWHRRP